MRELSPGAARHEALAKLAGIPFRQQDTQPTVTHEDILGWLGPADFSPAKPNQTQFLTLNRDTAMTIDQALAETDPARVTLFVDEPAGLNPEYLARLQREGFTLVTPWQQPRRQLSQPEPSVVRLACGIMATVCLTLMVHQPDWLQVTIRQLGQSW